MEDWAIMLNMLTCLKIEIIIIINNSLESSFFHEQYYKSI